MDLAQKVFNQLNPSEYLTETRGNGSVIFRFGTFRMRYSASTGGYTQEYYHNNQWWIITSVSAASQVALINSGAATVSEEQ